MLRHGFSILLAIVVLFLSGCATNRAIVSLPYTMPALGDDTPSPSSEYTGAIKVIDYRQERSVDMFLSEPVDEFVTKALEAELSSIGAFASILPQGSRPAPDYLVEIYLHEITWAVPNHKGMVKTAFWTSFLTGGVGGLIYGSTDTPVFGHVSVDLKIKESSTNTIVLEESLEGLHEEKIAKLKSDTLTTKARVIAMALKNALVKASRRISTQISDDPAPVSP